MPSSHSLYRTRWRRLRQLNRLAEHQSGHKPSVDFLAEYSNKQLLETIELDNYHPKQAAAQTNSQTNTQTSALIIGAGLHGLYQPLSRHFAVLNQIPLSKLADFNQLMDPAIWRNGQADLVISPHLLDWASPDEFMPPLMQALKPGGQWVFSFFGVRTAADLAALLASHDACPHFQLYYDMADVGDHLAGLGLGNVVLESTKLHLQYTAVAQLLKDAKLIGGANFNPQRRRTLTATDRYQKIIHALEQYILATGKITLEIEICYGRAIKKPPASVRVSLPVSHNGGNN